MNISRLHKIAIRLGLLLVLTLIGIAEGRNWNLSYTRFAAAFYWSGVGLLGFVFCFGRSLQALIASLRFQSRVRSVLTGLGNDRHILFQAAQAIHQEQEEKAMDLLDELGAKTPPDVAKTARWMRALAGTRAIRRQRRAISPYRDRERFTQIHAVFFSHGRVPIRRALLAKDLDEIGSAELDAFALAYIELVDELIAELSRADAPFHTESEELLEFLTGRVYLLGAHERFQAWWTPLKRVLKRGGGALLAGVRLTQRECYGEAARLLERLSSDGLLSAETETVRRMAAFFALITRPQWRLTSQEIPKYFRDLHYHSFAEMGVLRFPAAEFPEVVECCQRARDLRETKKSFIDDLFQLWAVFGEELAGPLAVILKRLLDHRGRTCPARPDYWRKEWESRREHLDEAVMALMDGVAAASAGQLSAAGQLFERTLTLDRSNSAPLVNLVYLRLAAGKEEEARNLAAEAVRRFPQDGGALISLGRLFATHLEDTQKAEEFFQRARELDKTSTEPLICLGELKLVEGKYNESQGYFDAAKQLEPGSPEAKLGLARTYMETKRYDLAVDNLTAVAEEGKGETQHWAHYLLYRTYRDMGNDRKAIEYLDKVPPPFFKEPEVLDDIAFHLESEKEYAKARVFSERAMLLRARGRDQGEHPEFMGEI